MIALIDYGAGNLSSVRKALAALGAEVSVPAQPEELSRAHGIIVPGVGHFAATRALDGYWTEAIRTHVQAGRPLLGVCLGLQWLFEGSDEAADVSGLGIFPGRCRRLTSIGPDGPVKVPHVGWNSLDVASAVGSAVGRAAGRGVGRAVDREASDAAILEGVPDGSQVYFTHSYAAPVTSDTTAIARHGGDFAAVVERGSVAGVQFHPEKSGDVGLRILDNFMRMAA